MQQGHSGEVGVSEVVGEMLMIALVIILLSVFSAALYNYLPVDREPTVTIMMTNDTLGNVTLWHKGGDWVNAEDLSVITGIIGNDTWRRTYTYNETVRDSSRQFMLAHPNNQIKKVFDLGSNITVKMDHAPFGNESIRLVTSRAVLYSGRIGL